MSFRHGDHHVRSALRLISTVTVSVDAAFRAGYGPSGPIRKRPRGLPEPSTGDGQDVAEGAEAQPQSVTDLILPVEPILGGENPAQRSEPDTPPGGEVQDRERIVGAK